MNGVKLKRSQKWFQRHNGVIGQIGCKARSIGQAHEEFEHATREKRLCLLEGFRLSEGTADGLAVQAVQNFFEDRQFVSARSILAILRPIGDAGFALHFEGTDTGNRNLRELGDLAFGSARAEHGLREQVFFAAAVVDKEAAIPRRWSFWSGVFGGGLFGRGILRSGGCWRFLDVAKQKAVVQESGVLSEFFAADFGLVFLALLVFRMAQNRFNKRGTRGSEFRIVPKREKSVVPSNFAARSTSPEQVENGASRKLCRFDGKLGETDRREDQTESDR